MGNYIDCQIYRGRLYLWTYKGTLCTYDWNRLVDSLISDEKERLAFVFTFKDGHYLYKHSLIEIFQDEEFRNLLISKFLLVTKHNLVISENQLSHFLIKEQEIPGGELPIDTDIYDSTLYFCNDYGLFKATAHRRDGNPVSSKPTKLWDARLLNIKADRYPHIALSAGPDGLYELDANRDDNGRIRIEPGLFRVSERHSSFANYSSLSIYSTSLIGSSFMAYYEWTGELRSFKRQFKEDIEDRFIFGETDKHNISWGGGNKIYRYIDNKISSFSFSNRTDDYNKKKVFSKNAGKTVQRGYGQIIHAETAFFGNILEFEDALVIRRSDSKSLVIEEPITRWRIYPRSINYENHLHVILDDRLDVYSFNHDYFIKQEEKEMGLVFEIEKKIHSSKSSFMEIPF